VAPRALLASAYQEAGEWARHFQTLEQARSLAPVTAEDYLFLGKAEAVYHPERAMKLLGAAVQKRPSVNARLAHGDALMNLARDRGDAEVAQRAAQEADLVKQLVPDNPVALRIALEARTIAIYAYQLAARSGQLDATIALARKDAWALKRFPHFGLSLLTRWQFLRALGEQDELLDELEKSRSPGCTEIYLLTLYRRGEFAKARAALARDKDVGAMYVCLVLSESPDGPEEILKRYRKEAENPNTPKWPLLTNQMALLLLGQSEKSRETCRAYRRQGFTSPIKNAEMQRALKYLSGAMTAEDYLKAAGASRVDQINVHYFVGLRRLAQGDRQAARDHFRKAVETGGFFFDHFELSRALLGRLEQDPKPWPPWIPIRKRGAKE
jgi:tetratricopeptide (TPR) repeat protein